MEKKMYSVRIIPEVKKVEDPDNEGAKLLKAEYVRKSKPDAKAIEKNFKPEEFLHMELYEEDENNFLGGDTKAYTEVLFKNANPILFDKLVSLLDTPEEYKVLNKKTLVVLLNKKLPGLVVNRKVKPYFATYMLDGKQKKLTSNRRNPESGDFEESPVVMEKLSYFLFANQVNETDSEIRFMSEKNRIRYWVTANTDEEVGSAEASVKEEDEGSDTD